jgi:hypothetical protein
MKSLLLLFISLFLYQSAFAASFGRVHQLSNERMMRLADIHEGLQHLHGHCGEAGLLQITARRINELWINTVKQAVYYSNTGVNAPVRNMYAEEADLRQKPVLEKFLVAAFSDQVLNPELSVADRQAINEFVALMGTLRGDYRFYMGGHQNSLGPAGFVVIVDLVNAEVLVLQSSLCGR